MEHHRRDASLDSIDIQFPKLDVAGSIPALALRFKSLALRQSLAFPFISKSKGRRRAAAFEAAEDESGVVFLCE